ncbi:DUF4326 domain-containing protein [Falsirhodobacter halotolerans]|uniref:DUF4326 domain-containing protein n=1 Tax=Falsirhodobacter halotolerans TaxID=1146892 RepID=UPI001FD28B2D|nr:DUF4326 domain-containing protein [Falsirhodobacter halotolerans]MCJ8138404.1 DUF4326 domain-containing protein [Falsirhodobacter halotolerans]
MAKRIKRSRAKGWRMPEGAVYVGRPTLWGNPWSIAEARECLSELGEKTDPAAIAVHWYRIWITGTGHQGRRHPPTIRMVQERLRGKDLACWCSLDQPCHADVLLEIANA